MEVVLEGSVAVTTGAEAATKVMTMTAVVAMAVATVAAVTVAAAMMAAAEMANGRHTWRSQSSSRGLFGSRIAQRSSKTCTASRSSACS